MHCCEVVRIETFLRLDYLCVLRVHTPGNGIIAPRLKKMSEFNGSAPTFSPEGKFLFFMKNRDIHWVSAKIIEELRPKKYTLLPVAGSEKGLLTTEEWLEDLDFVVSTLKSQHPNIYYKTNEPLRPKGRSF